jgi:hypothetical protein
VPAALSACNIRVDFAAPGYAAGVVSGHFYVARMSPTIMDDFRDAVDKVIQYSLGEEIYL